MQKDYSENAQYRGLDVDEATKLNDLLAKKCFDFLLPCVKRLASEIRRPNNGARKMFFVVEKAVKTLMFLQQINKGLSDKRRRFIQHAHLAGQRRK